MTAPHDPQPGCNAGKGRLRQRLGGYQGFLAQMRHALRGKPQIARLNTAVGGDFTNGLLSAWARVCDVLGFYQERIASEGYLGTATDDVSVLWLAERVGARRGPAIAARVELAITLTDAQGQPDRTHIGPGRELAVQTVPQNNQMPVIFEADAPLELRTAWNAIALASPTDDAPTMVWQRCRSLNLIGTGLEIRPGDMLLIGVQPPGGAASSVAVRVRTAASDIQAGTTLVCWDTGLPDIGKAASPITSVHLLKPRAGLFGRNAQVWADLPAAKQGAIGPCPGGVLGLVPSGGTPVWRSPSPLPPPGTIAALAAPPGGALIAGTSRGLFALGGDGGWTALPLPPGRHDIRALTSDPTDQAGARLFAGSAAGLVFGSGDGGASWGILEARLALPGSSGGFFLTRWLHPRHDAPASAAAGLPAPINALLVVEGGAPRLFAGTEQGVYVSDINGLEWHPFNSAAFPGFNKESGAASIHVRALAFFKGRVIAATAQGLFSTAPDSADWAGARLPSDAQGGITALAMAGGGATLFVGTSAGVLATPDLHRWAAFNQGLGETAPAVSGLAAHPGGLIAATSAGLFTSPDYAPRWQALADQALALFEADPALAPTTSQPSALLIARFARAGIVLAGNWTLTSLPPHTGESAAWLLVEASGNPQRFRLAQADAGSALQVAQLVPVISGARDLVACCDGQMMAATAPQPTIAAEWPDFTIAGNTLVLDRKFGDARVGDRIALIGDGADTLPGPRLRGVVGCAGAAWAAFGRQASVTLLTVEDDPGLAAYDLRQTQIYRLEAALTACPPVIGTRAPPAGKTLQLAVGADGLSAGRRLMLTGPRVAAVVLSAKPGGRGPGEGDPISQCSAAAAPELDRGLIGAAARPALLAAGLKLSRGASVAVHQPGAEWVLRDGDNAWRVFSAACPPSGATADPQLSITPLPVWEVMACPQDPVHGSWQLAAGGDTRVLAAEAVALIWQPPLSTQPSVAEAASIAAITAQGGGAAVELAQPLNTVFDTGGLRVSANVTLATHGETVRGELLGQPASRPGRQSFRLQRWPLAHLAAPPGEAPRPILHVAVGGAAAGLRRQAGQAPQPGESWHNVPSLDLCGAGDRGCEVALDELGRTVLWFGDGVRGAALPPGRNNVTASYRVGGGSAGNVPAGSLVAMRKRVAGIRHVTNPLPATGGVDPETTEALRRRAPLRLRHFDRIVTLADYAGFAEDFAGIARAHAMLGTAADGMREVWLTLLGVEAGAATNGIGEALRRAIIAARADNIRLRLLEARAVPFTAKIVAGSTGRIAAPLLRHQLHSHLLTRFGAGQRAIGAGVTASELIDAARECPGVADVTLSGLHRIDGGNTDQLHAAPPHRAAGRIVAGEVLVLSGAQQTRVEVA